MMANTMAPHIINVFRVLTIGSLYLFGSWPIVSALAFLLPSSADS